MFRLPLWAALCASVRTTQPAGAQGILLRAFSLALCTLVPGLHQAFAEMRYPDLRGQWTRFIVPGASPISFDQTKPGGKGQQAPLTPEYQRIFEKSLADQAMGKQGNLNSVGCIPFGMPMMMNGFFYPQEYIVTPEATYILIFAEDHGRRIFTDGRDWPKDADPTFSGYSIGKWVDEDNDGLYDVLEVETRGPFRGPRSYDSSGLPLHHDNDSVFQERIFLDKSDPNILHDVITVIDRALTRPWTVDKRFVRKQDRYPQWMEVGCADNQHVIIGKEDYLISADGHLMPTRKDQPPPDLKYFKPTGQK